MEKAVAKVRFEGLDDEGETSASEGVSSGGEEEEEARELVMRQNRKGKKSGGFQSMGLSHAVFKGVMRKGYRVPTPIQRRCIPLIMAGKDVVAMARTGSGKTAAFLVPLLERLKTHSAKIGVRGLILSPTRELATQTMKFTKELGKFSTLRATLVLGGDKMEEQFAALHENPDIIIATPGRFLHLVMEMALRLSSIKYVVFDEADRLFEMGFSEQLHEILHRLPESRQTLLFSATLPKLLVDFAKAGLREPTLVRLDVDSKLSEQLGLSFLSTRSEDKPAALLHFLRHVVAPGDQTVVFTATKHHVEYLKELLQAFGMECAIVYSSLDQAARKINVAKFVNKKTQVMLVTDIAARGIDIPMLDNVINYNFPAKPKLFVHRVGRVARAGRSGHAYSLVSPDETAYLLDLHLFLGRPLQMAGGRGKESPGGGVYGSIPQFVVDEQQEAIQQIHMMSSADLPDLRKVADNAQKQYVRSRPQPAPESVKRAKDLPSVILVHPLFEEYCSTHELERAKVLERLKSFRPQHTILEVHSTAGNVSKQVMKTKREQHGRAVSAKHRKVASVEGDRKVDEYLHYTPADLYSEKGLSLGSSFDQQLAGAQLELDGDEGAELGRFKAVKKWDRKRKKFVGETGKEGRKKIKTESGRVIAASYKTNLYKQWKDKHKIEGELIGTEEEAERKHWRGQTVARSRGRGRGKAGQRGEEGGLKAASEILRMRKTKEFQEARRKLRQRRKAGEGGSYKQPGATRGRQKAAKGGTHKKPGARGRRR